MCEWKLYGILKKLELKILKHIKFEHFEKVEISEIENSSWFLKLF